MPKNNNDYDDIFKTLKYNHKRLFISLINKAFNKSYPLNIVPTILPTDSYIENPDTDKIEERESDLLMSICGDTYLIECQSYEDGTMAIDEIGENADNGMYNGAQIYGMGTSVKSVALLDAGKIKCLVIPDGYGVGYASVTEVVKGLNSRLYTMKSREEGIKIIYSDDLFSEDVERFLYSYE